MQASASRCSTRRVVGHGSTVASTALLMQETDSDFRELAARYGPGRASRIWDLSREATGDFIRTLGRLNIDCVRLDSTSYVVSGFSRLRSLRDASDVASRRDAV
jgi:hypothetical protein